MQIKLDELIRSIREADTRLLDLEELGDGDLEEKRAEYEHLAAQARQEAEATA